MIIVQECFDYYSFMSNLSSLLLCLATLLSTFWIVFWYPFGLPLSLLCFLELLPTYHFAAPLPFWATLLYSNSTMVFFLLSCTLGTRYFSFLLWIFSPLLLYPFSHILHIQLCSLLPYLFISMLPSIFCTIYSSIVFQRQILVLDFLLIWCFYSCTLYTPQMLQPLTLLSTLSLL